MNLKKRIKSGVVVLKVAHENQTSTSVSRDACRPGIPSPHAISQRCRAVSMTGYGWDLSCVDGIDDRRGSPVPKKGIPLNEFMKGAVPKHGV